YPNFEINGRHLVASQFEKHLIYFKKNYNIISLSEMFRSYQDVIIPDKKNIALTFDDGYVNNLTVVLPILKKYNVPATFFIVSSGLEDNNYVLWPDIIDLIRKFSGAFEIEIGSHVFQNTHNLFSTELNISAYDYIKNMGYEREEVIKQLKLKYNFEKILAQVSSENYAIMSKEQLQLFSQSPLVEIGSHTHSHYNLGNIDKELVANELLISKEKIQNIIQKEVNKIAFPDGSYNENVKKISIDSGYKNLIAVSYKCQNDKDDINILPRYTISNTTTFESNMIQVGLGFERRGF
ncbi:MAG TPA: polysaccharide deacetylase family protein, partial [Bacteroidia bacterium]|nr:polysaccharide deacetylase family protein [Bacteroidia bacterium]